MAWAKDSMAVTGAQQISDAVDGSKFSVMYCFSRSKTGLHCTTVEPSESVTLKVPSSAGSMPCVGKLAS